MKLWHPIPLIRDPVVPSGLEYRRVEREEDSIAGLKWFQESDERDDVERVRVRYTRGCRAYRYD